jgi:hypothetical protein
MHLVQVQEDLAGFAERGARVVAIGQGTGRQAAGFAGAWGVDIPILGDASGAAYQAYGMLRGTWWTVVLRSLVQEPVTTLRLIAKADRKGAALPASDVLRLPGVAIVARGARIRFLHKGREPSEFPSNAEIFAALGALSEAGPPHAG